MSEINILVLSAGTRNKVICYFKQELEGRGRVIATDCNELAPAIYLADAHYIVPRITDEHYIDTILDICKKENITALFSLIDPELTLLAENRQLFLGQGVIPIVSSPETIEICFNKYKMSEFLKEHGFPAIQSYDTLASFESAHAAGDIGFPVFVKPVCGSCSMDIQKVTDMESLRFLVERYENLMIQEYMPGTEYGIDVYTDMLSGKTAAIFIKEKLLMRAGETDKSVSVKIPALFDLILDFCDKLPFFGHVDVDVFERDGAYYISEVNPRFGGGYPHAYECGVNIPKMIIQNLSGLENPVEIGNYEEHVYMMKYLDVLMRRGNK